MAPTHNRVVGMDPDDVKTPVSQSKSWDKERRITETAPPLPVRASTQTQKNGEVAGANGAEDEERPQLPTRPSEIAGYGGAEVSRIRTEERVEHIRHDLRANIEKLKSLGHHRDPKSSYFTIAERINNHLEKQYTKLCDGESGLRSSVLIKFLREEQGQEIQLPEDKLARREFGMVGERRWSYKDWLALMCRSGALEGVRPVGKVGLVKPDNLGKHEETEEEKDALRYPITSYLIDSSHNTYLQGHQWFSTSTADAYKYVLQKGCRCIEIDVHNGDSILKSASSAKSYMKPTTPSELISEASKKLDKGKSKWKEFKTGAKRIYHEKKESISGSKPTSPRLDDITRGTNMEHRRSQSSTSTVPTISRDPTSDSEGSADVHTNEGSAVNLTADGKQGSNKSSRASSKSSNASSAHPERTGEPIVMHGWTPTTKWCLFRDVCKTVAQHAFETTNLPLIVSLEVACSLDQQELMVQIMKEEWGSMLVGKPLPECNPTIRQPRLYELFNKILVKVKRHVPHGEELADAAAATNAAAAGPTSAPNGAEKLAAPLVGDNLTPSTSTPSLQTTLLTPNASSTSVSSVTPTQSMASLSPSTSTTKLEKLDTASTKSSNHSNPSPKPPKPPKICKTLSDLGIYTHSAHFANFLETSSYSPSHIYSIDEHVILKLYDEHAAEMHAHNKKYFMRAYPEWKRIGSSNLDPSVYWRKGVQMAAVNAQTWDEGTMVNRGMFEGSGGWILKPANLRPPVGAPKTWNPKGKTREEAEAGLNGKMAAPLPVGTPVMEQQIAMSPTSIDSAIEDKTPIGLGLGLEEHIPKPLDRAIALDGPPQIPSRKPSKKVKSPRQSNASLGPNPASSLSPKSSSTPVITSPKLGGALSVLVMGQPKQKPKEELKEVEKPKPKMLNLYFKIYAAQGLIADHDADIHPRVKIEMHAERDGEYKPEDWKKETKTRHTSNPDWDGEQIKFLNIGSKGDEDDHVRGHIAGPQEELSFVRFKIEDDNRVKKDVMLAWRAVRLDRLRTGWRFLRLWDAEGEEGGGLLLIHVKREEV